MGEGSAILETHSQEGSTMSVAKEESALSMGMTQPLPRLRAATYENLEINKAYKSGASYQGQVQGEKKFGRGVFTWPNGASYEGEFVDNCRHGDGRQRWPDGSYYEGEFVEDMRHGCGAHHWTNGETYSGVFFKDRRHGAGVYQWPDKSQFDGTFYMDRKEGYGEFTFADGSKFEGLYKMDEREGPGVMSYPDGKQDVGLWHREHLAKICVLTDGAFTMEDHPEFEYFPEEHRKYITLDNVENRIDVVDSIVNPPEDFDYEPRPDILKQTSALFADSLHDESLAIEKGLYEEEFQRGSRVHSAKSSLPSCVSSAKSGRGSRAKSRVTISADCDRGGSATTQCSVSAKPVSAQVADAKSSSDVFESPVVAWNNTPSCVAMQKHILRHKASFQRAPTFDVELITQGQRSSFACPGPKETAAQSFLQAAAAGDVQKTAFLLNTSQVSVDVADKDGRTALLAASVGWHQDVINCLLDNGADVNKLSDEGVSALAACHIFFYPVDSFKYNIAERYRDKPAESEEKEAGYDVNEAIRGILSKSGRRTSPDRRNTMDVKKIQQLREEYGPRRVTLVDERDNTDDRLTDQNEIATENDQTVNHGSPSDHKIGTLQIRRSAKLSVEAALSPEHRRRRDDDDRERMRRDSASDAEEGSGFESDSSVHSYEIDVSDRLIERCATGLSQNDLVVGRGGMASEADIHNMGTVRRLAADKKHQELMETTIRLLLRRGADPNASAVPMPVLFFAIKAADVGAVRVLLAKGASTATTLSSKKGGLCPLHIAAAVPGEDGVQIVELLLASLADPDARATEDDSFLNRNLEEEWCKDAVDEQQRHLLGGRSPLHIACARDDSYKNACRVVHLLLDHHANPNLMCNGHSPLALSVASGNDLAIDELLLYGADPCLALTHGVGSVLCIASSTEYEHRRTPDARINLIDKLVSAGGNILAPIPIGPKRTIGTAVDFAYYMYNLDRRIAHMPYHALSPAERETFNARRRLLAHVGNILRGKAVARERTRLDEETLSGRRSRSPSPSFVYIGAGAKVQDQQPQQSIIKSRAGKSGLNSESRVSFRPTTGDPRKPLFRYCYECGRSVGVRLSPCTRCKEVHYCSKACKLKAWNARHKEECVRIGGQSTSPAHKDRNRIDSPTPATDPDRGRATTVKGISGKNDRVKLPPLVDSSPNLFMRGLQDANALTDNDNDHNGDDARGPNGPRVGRKRTSRRPRGGSANEARSDRNNCGYKGRHGDRDRKSRADASHGRNVRNKMLGNGGGYSESEMFSSKVPQKGRSLSAQFEKEIREKYGDRHVFIDNYSFV